MRACSGDAGPVASAAISHASSSSVCATCCSRDSTRSTRRVNGSHARDRRSGRQPGRRVGRKISLRDALASDPAPLRAPPAWTNSELGVVNGMAVLHAGSGMLDGGWHRQTSDEFLLVLEGELVVEFEAGPLVAGPGEAILIAAGGRPPAPVPRGGPLPSVEAGGLRRAPPRTRGGDLAPRGG